MNDEIKNSTKSEAENLEEVTGAETELPKNFGVSRFDLNKLILSGSIFLAAILISGSMLYVNHSQKSLRGAAQVAQGGAPGKGLTDRVNVSVDDDPFLGSKDAPVTVIEFSDFQCPFCRKFWKDTLSQLKKDYINTGKARFVYRDFPLDFHPGSKVAAEGSECANEQGKYWPMHDRIFEEQGKQGEGTVQFSAVEIKKWAGAVGVNQDQFNKCLDSHKYKAEVEKDLGDGGAAGVSGTPTLFINGRPIVGAQPYVSFKTVIDQELAKK